MQQPNSCMFFSNMRQGSDLLFRHGAHVRHDNFVDEAAESQTEIRRDVLHRFGQEVAEQRQLVLVVLHGLAEVHEVVQVDRVVFRLRVVHPNAERLVFEEITKIV